MALIKEEAFLLALVPYKDSDLIAKFLSARHGLLTANLPRARKMGKGQGFSQQPGDLLELEYQTLENQDFIRIKSQSPLAFFHQDQELYPRFLQASLLQEFILKTAKADVAYPQAFRSLGQQLHLKWSKEGGLGFLVMALVQGLEALGVLFDLNFCQACHRPTLRKQGEGVQFRRQSYLHQRETGLICSDCRGQDGPITSAMLKLFWLAQRANGPEDLPQNLPLELLQGGLAALVNLAELELEIRLQSAKFLVG